MKGVVPTRRQVERGVRQWTTWIAAALVGGGVALSLSIIFIGPGLALLALGVGVAVVGWLASRVVPLLLPQRSLLCPWCQQASGVYIIAKSFSCEGCGRLVPVQGTKEVPELTIDEPGAFTLARRMLIVFTALSYVAFFIEVYLGHYLWLQLFLRKLIFSFSIIPVFFSPIALLMALAAAFRLTPGPVMAFRTLMLASILVGVGGTYFHLAARVTTMADLLAVGTWLGDPPVLAPFAFALPGIMGLVATYGLRWQRALPTEGLGAVGTPGEGSPTGAEEPTRSYATPERGETT